MKKRFGIILLTLMLVLALGTTVIAQKASNPAVKVYKEDKVVKVFVGRPSGPIMSNAYKDNRNDTCKKLLDEDSEKIMDSIIVLNNFATADQLEKIFDGQSVTVKRIWLAEPGTIGAGDNIVYNNDLETAVNNWVADFQQFYNEGKAKNVKLNKNTEKMFSATKENRVKVYAILVSAPVSCLNTLSDNSLIDFIDIHYDKDAEDYGNSKDYKVKYIDIPMRPDGIS